jgi:hypothetical protein
MLDLGENVQKHEKDLFTLFDPTKINKDILTANMTKIYYKYSKKIRYDAMSLPRLLTDGQKAGKARNISLMEGLYHLFWFKTSPGTVQESRKPDELIYKFNIDRRYYDSQAAGTFFTEFARHIYTKSFKV